MQVMTVKEASRYLKISTNTLATWRHEKRGPQFIKTGRSVKYRLEDLDAYLKQNTIKTR